MATVESVGDARTQELPEDPLAYWEMPAPDEVHGFLALRPELQRLLREVSCQLRDYFPEARLRVEHRQDPEESSEQLLVLAITTLPAAEALDRLDRFDREWWLDHSPQGGGICVDVGF